MVLAIEFFAHLNEKGTPFEILCHKEGPWGPLGSSGWPGIPKRLLAHPALLRRHSADMAGPRWLRACVRRVGCPGVGQWGAPGEGTFLTVTGQREGRAAAAEGAVFGGRLGKPLTGGQREGGCGVEQHQVDSHDIP